MKRRFLTIVLAGLLAVLGAVAILAYVHQADKRAIAGDVPVTVLEAVKPIPAGTPLGAAWSQKWLTPGYGAPKVVVWYGGVKDQLWEQETGSEWPAGQRPDLDAADACERSQACHQ